jgi:phospholipid transport system substrate-binding protein
MTMQSIKRISHALCLVVAALFLASAVLPSLAHAAETVKVTKKKTASKKKATTKSAHHKVTKKKTSSKKTTTKIAVVAPAAATLKPTSPSVTVPVVAKPRSLSQMGNPPSAKGGSASEVVRQFYVSLTDTMKQGDSLGFNGRAQRLEAAMDRSFNMNDMMRTAAGSSWGSATPDQQQQMVSAFRKFSVANYASRFPRYEGENFEVVSERPGPNGSDKIVETRLTSGSDKVDLNYLMRQNGSGQWRIVDVYLDGTISEMASRRSEFGSVLRSQGVPAFLQLLDQKSAQLGNS